ncbi:PF10973 family protein [Bacteriovorax sp. BSW11_IV]|uniref:DUF2799 domain-containing protein n=1 Tax=Bacteriovorax sp. BSW11_IV TaxID=1353529 RepID=UPI00038A4301|nr:DUF2799 domain-containing protein [Bacteriovorax sp. BSW11_IV]EQC44933.1 PF10973 family protein [Bacteriovorax sp. BSW11_IV]
MGNGLIAAMSAMLILSGCASYSKKDCEQINWNNRAHELALDGLTKDDALSRVYGQCTRPYNVTPDFEAFSKGFEKGANEFCAPENALEFGKNGKIYKKTCPKELESEFIKNYTTGLNIYLTQRVDDLSSDYDDLKNEIQQLKEDNEKLKNK